MTTSVDITGLRKAVTKQLDLTLDQYNGLAKEGDLIIDCNPGPTLNQLFVGTANGSLVPVSNGGGGNSNYSNANVANYLPIYTGNISGDYIILTHDVTANVVDANYLYGEGSNVTNVAALTANTVIDSAQPNITSVGTLTSLTVAGAVLPAANVTHDLGSPTQRWNSIYLSNNTIYLGNSALSVDSGGNLTVDGDAVATVNSSGNLVVVGNIQADNVGTVAAINLDGNVANVLAGDGTWIAAGGSGNAVLPIANGTSNFNIPNANGPVDITAAGNTWEFDGDSTTIFFPNNSNIGVAGNNMNFGTPVGGAVQFYTDNGNKYFSLDSYGYVNLPFAAGIGNSAAIASQEDISLMLSGGNNFRFTAAGTVIFPTLTVDLHNGGNQYAQTLQFGGAGQQAVITGPTPQMDTNAERLIIQGQRGQGTGEGGDVYLWAGDSEVNGGDIKIYAGDADTSGYGGYINLDGGSGIDGGGQLSLSGGYSSAGQGGAIYINGGSGSNGGVVEITGGGGADTQGGNIRIIGGYGQANGGEVRIIGGSAGAGLPGYGNIVLASGASEWTFDIDGLVRLPSGGIIDNADNNFEVRGVENVNLEANAVVNIYTDGSGNAYQWQFGDDGNLILAGGNSVIASLANSAGDGSGLSTLNLYPDSTTGDDRYLVIDPTGPAHLHLRAGGAQDASSALLYLGGEQTYVQIDDGYHRVSINSYDTANSIGYNWRFDWTGNLVLPGNTIAINYANGDAIFGNVSTITLDGNVANVLAGDGTWIAAGGGGGNANTGNFVFANSTMSTPYPDIMLIQTLDASGANLRTQLRFDPDLSQASMSARSSTFNQSYTTSSWTTAEYTGTQIDFVDAPDLVQFLSSSSFDNGVNKQFSINGGNMTAYTSASYSASNVTIYTSVPASPDPTTVTTIEFAWQLESEFEIDYDDPSMNITARGMNIEIRNNYVQNYDINIYSGDDITLQGRNKLSGTTSEGGDINVYAGRGSADDGLGNPSGGGGDIQVYAGDGGSGNSGSGAQGGFARLRAGVGGSAGVSASAGTGGHIEIEAGNGGDNNGNIELGSLGGYVSITAGSTTLANIQGGNVSIQSGAGGANSLAGNVSIITPAGDIGVGGTWIFDGDGLLTLPGGSSKIGSILGTDAILANNQSFGVATQGNSVTTFLNWSDDIANTSMLSAIYVNAPMGNAGDIYLRTGDVASPNVWQFGSDGTTLIPGNIDVNNQHIINVATITADVVLIPANTMTTDTLDLATGNLFVRTITGATTLSLLNIPTAGNNTAFTLQLTDAGSNITWWSGIKWANGTPPTLTVSGTDVLSFYSYDGGTTWVGIVLAQNIS